MPVSPMAGLACNAHQQVSGETSDFSALCFLVCMFEGDSPSRATQGLNEITSGEPCTGLVCGWSLCVSTLLLQSPSLPLSFLPIRLPVWGAVPGAGCGVESDEPLPPGCLAKVFMPCTHSLPGLPQLCRGHSASGHTLIRFELGLPLSSCPHAHTLP